MLKVFVRVEDTSASLLTMMAQQAADGVEILPDRRHHERRDLFKGMREHERRKPLGRDHYGVVRFAERQRNQARLSCPGQIVVIA